VVIVIIAHYGLPVLLKLQHPVMNNTEMFECRICRDENPPLLRPCRCSSSVHVTCLKRWVESRTSVLFPLTFSPKPPSCEVCLAPYTAAAEANATRPGEEGCKNIALADHGPYWLTRFRLGLCAPDPLALLPRSAVCDHIVSLESCLLLCLTALAISGHTIFLVHMRAHVSVNEYPRERVLLAGLNALLSACILVLVQKIVSRWLRDGQNLAFSNLTMTHRSDIESPPLGSSVNGHVTSGTLSTSIGSPNEEQDVSFPVDSLHNTLENSQESTNSEETRQQSDGVGTGRNSSSHISTNSVGHFVLGAFLSVAASAEVYLLLSAL
jgi:RING-variant domain